MNLINIADEIMKKNKDIDKIRADIRQRGENKAKTIATYEKTMSLTIIKLKNGETFELDGNAISNPQTTILEKIAKGICWETKLEMETADALYRSATTNLQAVIAQLNSLQSLFRHLDRG